MTSSEWLKLSALVFVFCVLTTFAGLRLLGPDTDFAHYLNLFNYGYHPQGDTKEPSFVLFRYVFSGIFGREGFYWFIFVYAVLGVGLKLYAIGRYSVSSWYSIFVYLMVYYPLHEYTQMRVGVATGIILLSLPDVIKGYRLGFLLKIFFAALFHWSALAVLPVYFFRGRQLYHFFAVIFIALLAIPFKAEVLSFVAYILSFSESLAHYYGAHSGHVESFRVVNIVFLLNLTLILCSFWLVLRGKISAKIDNLPSLLVAVHLFSLFVYLFFSVLDRPVISFRLSELYSVVVLLSVPLFSKLSGRNVFIKLVVFFVPVIYFWHLVFRVDIFPGF